MNITDQDRADKITDVLERAAQLEAFIARAAAEGRSLYDVEKSAWAAVLEIGYRALQAFFQMQGNGDLGPIVQTADERTLHRSQDPQQRVVRTVFGRHTFSSYVYSPGPKKKIELRPIDARLSLGEGACSHLLEEFSQHFCVEQAFAAASASLETVLGQSLPVDTLERISRRLGEQAEEFSHTLSPPPAEEEGQILVLTADGKGVPILRREAEPAPAGAESSAPERDGGKRMATLACVYSVDPHVRTPEDVVEALFRESGPQRPEKTPRPKPQHKRLTARFSKVFEEGTEEESVMTGADNAVSWAAQQVQERLQENQPLVVLCDGQESLWTAIRRFLAVWLLRLPAGMVEILDILHAASYLWLAARAFYPHNEQARRRLVRERLLRILSGAAAGVIRGLRQMAAERKLQGKAAADVSRACNYLQNNLRRMRYDEYLAAGYPIASGVIEGACRHVVKDRLERTGMRWTLAGAQAMLYVRCAYASSLWDEFHRARRERERTRLHPHRHLVIESALSDTLAV